MTAAFVRLAIAYAVCATAFAADPLTARESIRQGSDHFIAGRIRDSIASFEQAIKLQPEVKPHLWQIGIAYYYAERFTDGRDLFELHQTVNQHDVENAVWHFLCVARADGVEAARKKLIPISGDARVPMKEIHALFAEKATADEVLRAATAVSDEARRKDALCYAHLYLGLYEEARGNHEKSREHIAKAARDYKQDHYMGRVAQVHATLRAKSPR